MPNMMMTLAQLPTTGGDAAPAPTTPAPGPAAPPPAPGLPVQTVNGAGTSTPPNSPPPPRQPSFMESSWPLLIMGLIVVIFLFTSSRNQKKEKKKRESMLAAMKKNDKVQTIGGVVGKVVEIDDHEVVLKVDESSNTRIRFVRSAIQTVLEESAS